MKKIAFLISILTAFFSAGLINIGALNQTTAFYAETDQVQIKINSGQYLNLSYQNGTFYSWNQVDDSNRHSIGIFNTTDQSYLLDSFGVFFNLDYQINNFSRIDDTCGVANIKYFQSKDKIEHWNRNFLISLNSNNTININDKPIDSQNSKFVKLNDQYLLGYGFSLDMIRKSDQVVKSLVTGDEGNYSTSFYRVSADRGVFIAADQFFYLLNNFNFEQGKVNKTLINDIKAPKSNKKHVVAINENNLVIRAEEDVLYFVDISHPESIIVKNWHWEDEDQTLITSQADNFAFPLNDETFILNISSANSSSSYGTPYLIETKQWDKFNQISNIKTINNFMFLGSNNGIFIDKDLNANSFTFQNDGSHYSFTLSSFGRLDSFQFINKNFFFGLVGNNNLLLSQTINPIWVMTEKIKFSPYSNNTSSNFLNNIITTEDQIIDYQNTYFSNGITNFNITDRTLNEIVIIDSEGTKLTLTPVNNNVTYNFSKIDNYQIEIYFTSSIQQQQSLNYRVNIVNFSDEKLVTVNGNNRNSYVGFSKQKLYDINLIDQTEIFTISDFDYQSLQYVKLFVYHDGVDTVVKNVYNLKNNSEIKVNQANDDPSYFFGLQITSVLNQVSWIYLGFNINGVKPMADFWETELGTNFMKQAISRRYLEKDLRAMNSKQIEQLMNESKNWRTIAFQGKTIAITIATIFALALVGIIVAVSFNYNLNNKIEIEQVEKNKTIKNFLDH